MVVEYLGRAHQAGVVLIIIYGLWDKPVASTLEALLPVASSIVP